MFLLRPEDPAIARGVEAMPLSMYSTGAAKLNGLILGFAPIRPHDAEERMRRLAASIDVARSRARHAACDEACSK